MERILQKKMQQKFIRDFISANNLDISDIILRFQNKWNTIETQYHQRAVHVFGCALEKDITAFLTVNTRHPYSTENNIIFISLNSSSSNKTIMHELWHFYTWNKFGEYEKKIGKNKYNEIKEALTVLLNDVYQDLLEGFEDTGYSQHINMRKEILTMWKQGMSINDIWKTFVIV